MSEKRKISLSALCTNYVVCIAHISLATLCMCSQSHPD